MKHYVGVQLRARLSAFGQALQAAQTDSSTADALHDLRVAGRRLNQALRLFRHFLRKKHVRRMRARVHDVVHECGLVRDCDVTLKTVEAAGAATAQLRAALTELRQQRQAEFQQHLASWRDGRSPEQWRPMLEPRSPRGTRWLEGQSAAQNAAHIMPGMVEDLFSAGTRAVETGKYAELHRFRLLGKRFRYSLELFQDVYGAKAAACVGQMKELQDKLGDINDCAAAIPYLEKFPDARGHVEQLLQQRRQAFDPFWQTFARQRQTWIHQLGG